MTLKEELATRAAATKQKLAPEKLAVMENATASLVDDHLISKTLKTGDHVKDFSLFNANNQKVSLSSVLKENKVVLSFYRGGWCPYCNMELKALQKVLPEIEANGAQLLAISPELPDHSLTTKEKNELSFEVLSDENNQVAKDFNLVFQMPLDLQKLYRDDFNIQVDVHNGNNLYELPMAATYIIDQSGKIIYHYINEKYVERAEPSELVTVLKNLP